MISGFNGTQKLDEIPFGLSNSTTDNKYHTTNHSMYILILNMCPCNKTIP